MESSTHSEGARGWLAAIMYLLPALLGTAPALAASGKKSNLAPASLIGVRFGEDCVSATVESGRPVKSLVAVFNDGQWEHMDGQPGIHSYVVKVGPNAARSGVAISTLYVDAGSRTQEDPLGIVPHEVGLGFECGNMAEGATDRNPG